MCCAACGDLGQRRQDAAGGEPAQRGGERDPADEHDQQHQPQLGEDVVDAVERAGELQSSGYQLAVDRHP